MVQKMLLPLLLSSLLGLVNSQAPGDRNDRCSLSPYGDHVRRLLDTRDYTKLLPYESDGTGGVWQVLDEDRDGDKWQTSSKVLCAESTKVCGRSSDPQENWMITQHISVPDNVTAVQVKINSTLDPPCPPSSPSCVDDLSLYVWETSTTNRTSAADTRNYRFVGSVSSGERVVEVSPVSKSGIYLGIRDNGTCVSVGRVLVYYSVCGAGAEGLVRVDQETVFSSAGDPVQGHCVENSVSTTDSAPQLQCQESGQWRVVGNCPPDTLQCRGDTTPCECLPGFQEGNLNGALVCSVCPVGLFSEGSGAPCEQCPGNSNSTHPGMAVCPCLNGYYRPLDSESYHTPCIKPREATGNGGSGFGDGEVIEVVFGSLCALLLLAISFILGVLLGRCIQRHKTSPYDTIPAHASIFVPGNGTKSCLRSPRLSPSPASGLPPPLPMERSNRGSREDVRKGGGGNSTAAAPVTPAPVYAVLEEQTLHGDSNNCELRGKTDGKNTSELSQAEPEYAVPSHRGVDVHRSPGHTIREAPGGSVSAPSGAEYAVLEGPTAPDGANGCLEPASSSLKPSAKPAQEIRIVVQDESGRATLLES